MYKEDLALNNLQWLICHKTQPNKHWLMSCKREDSNEWYWLVCLCVFTHLSSKVGCDMRSILNAQFNRFEFQVYLLDWLR